MVPATRGLYDKGDHLIKLLSEAPAQQLPCIIDTTIRPQVRLRQSEGHHAFHSRQPLGLMLFPEPQANDIDLADQRFAPQVQATRRGRSCFQLECPFQGYWSEKLRQVAFDREISHRQGVRRCAGKIGSAYSTYAQPIRQPMRHLNGEMKPDQETLRLFP